MKSTKRKVTKRQAAPLAVVPAMPVNPTPISSQASEPVGWYCGVTKHHEDAAVEGAVFGTLERAKAAYDESSCHDEAFNWLMEDVLRGMNDFDREVGPRTPPLVSGEPARRCSAAHLARTHRSRSARHGQLERALN